jgi:YVTN family beta-propeller protein
MSGSTVHAGTRGAQSSVRILGVLLLTVSVVGLVSSAAAGAIATAHGAAEAPNASALQLGSSIGPTRTPSASGVGAVIDVDNLLTDTVLPGASLPSEQTDPQSGIYDASNGNFYVRGNSGETLSVINGTADREIAVIPVSEAEIGYAQVPSIAVDPLYGTVFVTNSNPGNISVIDGSTESIVTSIPLLGEPTGIVADPTTGDLFVADSSLKNVTVISGLTNSVVTSIPVGTQPNGIVYDPTDHRVFVANFGSSNVTVINALTDKVVTNLATGHEPLAMVWDSANDYLDVANYGGSSVSIFSAASGAHLWTYPLGSGTPIDLTYSPDGDRVFVVNFFPNNATVIDQAPYGAGGSFSLPGTPQWAAYDATDKDVFVACPESYAVSILAASPAGYVGNLTIRDFPTAVLVDSANGRVLSVNTGSSSVDANATVLDPTTVLPIANIPLTLNLAGVTYDPTLSTLEVADEYGNSTFGLAASSGLGEYFDRVGDLPIASAYDSKSGDLFVLNRAASNLSTIGPAGTIVGSLTMGDLLTGVTVDNHTGVVYVSSDEGNVTVIDPANPAVRSSILIGGDVSLGSVLYDPHSNEVYVSNWENGTIAVIDPATNATVGRAIPVGSEPTALTYDPVNKTVFVVNQGSGNLSVIDTATDEVVRTIASAGTTALAYDQAKNAMYAVGEYTPLVTAVNASTYASLGAGVELGNVLVGGIGYDPLDHRVLVADVYDGCLLEIGTPSSSPSDYTITFTESGLAPTTSWSITLASLATSSSSTSTIVFSEPNATYDFTVGAVPGYVAPTGPGHVTVSGGAVAQGIDFYAKFGDSLSTNATAIVLDGSVTLTTTLTGGVSPYEFEYSLPSPCESANASTVVCAPGALGTYHVHVNVTDRQGQIRMANATFTVQSSAPPPSGPKASPPTWEWFGPLVLVLAALLAIAVWWTRRRKKAEPAPSNPPAGGPGTPPPATGSGSAPGS